MKGMKEWTPLGRRLVHAEAWQPGLGRVNLPSRNRVTGFDPPVNNVWRNALDARRTPDKLGLL
jgi:hypothetical protein